MFVQTCKRTTKISRNIQKTHQNQHKHTKDTPKSTQTYKRTTKINTNIQKTNQNQHKHTKEPPVFTSSLPAVICRRAYILCTLFVFDSSGVHFIFASSYL
jgi:hypothetical protein